MAKMKTPKQIEIKIRSLKKQVSHLESQKKKSMAMAKKKAVKKTKKKSAKKKKRR